MALVLRGWSKVRQEQGAAAHGHPSLRRLADLMQPARIKPTKGGAMSESRIPRRSLFAVLASIPLALVGLVGRRQAPALPPPALPAPEAVPEVVAEVVPDEGGDVLFAQMMRHTESMQKTLLEGQQQYNKMLIAQLDQVREENERLASSQYELLELQQKLLDEQLHRDAKANGTA